MEVRDIAQNLLITPVDNAFGYVILIASKSGKFNITDTWRHLRLKKNKIPWHNFVWSSLNVPKFSFISWLAILDRLNTLSRMKYWGLNIQSTTCFLCLAQEECRDICFFIVILT